MGNIHIQPSQHQKNIDVPLELIPNVIDELPILATLALTQPGTFVLEAEELRVKNLIVLPAFVDWYQHWVVKSQNTMMGSILQGP